MKVLVLLALASAVTGIEYDGLRVKFGNTSEGTDKDYFFRIPRNVLEAAAAGWVPTQRPDGPMRELNMYCPRGRIVCALYFNNTNFVAGLQIAAPVSSIDQSLHPENYFIKWDTSAVGDEPAQLFWTATQYYVNDSSKAGPTNENNSTLQQNGVWVQGLNGKLMKIDISEDKINKTDFKKQNCVTNMGTHYYWNMTQQLTCDKQMLPWFPLVKKGQLLGVGFQTFGRKPILDAEALKHQKDYYEDLPKKRKAPLHAIPLAPECFLDLSQKHGRLSIHIYFINKPWEITCEPGDSIKNAVGKPVFFVPMISTLFLIWKFV